MWGAFLLFAAGFYGQGASLEIRHGSFSVAELHVPPGTPLRLVNRDRDIYTVESPGAFVGDVLLAPNSDAVVRMRRGGDFVAMIEERPESEVRLHVDADPNQPLPSEPPFDQAKARGLQPLDLEGREPGYGAVTQFDLNVTGESARQAALVELYRLEEELAGESPPTEFAPYFSAPEWAKLRTSVAMVVGFGPAAYDRKRFGPAVAATMSKDLHRVSAPAKLGIPGRDTGQRDVLVRVTSSSLWFNLRVCRSIWRRMGARISNRKLEWGYDGPRGRSPILGGFYDGTGNPSGPERSKAEFGVDGAAMLAIYRIRFDEKAFLANPKDRQEAIIGREKASGRPQKHPDALAHKVRASDPKSFIVRMPLIFDDGMRGTGLLFLASASRFTPLETLLGRLFNGPPHARDHLLKYMHFEAAGYYEVPPSPKGGYPGTLRKSAFTFGS